MAISLEIALSIVQEILGQSKLTEVQETVFRGVWAKQSYQEIINHAAQNGFYYSLGHLKNTGSDLWQSLSEALGERVTKSNLPTLLERYQQQHQRPKSDRQDWGEAASPAQFYGRTRELTMLKSWIVKDQCRVVALLGMGGMGKTSLATKLAQEILETTQYERIFWRSLLNAPTIDCILQELIQFLSDQQEVEIAATVEGKITQSLAYLRQTRCLVVLDNIESILQDSSSAGAYRPDYEAYGLLMQRFAEVEHSSCLLLTSREKPREVAWAEGPNLLVRSFLLKGLTFSAGQTIFQHKGCFGLDDRAMQNLFNHYAGNPLALNIVASGVQELFDGDLKELLPYMQQGWLRFDDINDVLNRQFDRLSSAEQEVMYWLAINREPVSHLDLMEDIVSITVKQQLLEALKSLARRCLIERNEKCWSLQPVVMEYVTNRLIQQVCREVVQQDYALLNSHALLKAQGKDYVRQAQSSLILQPLLATLLSKMGGQKNVGYQLKDVLEQLRIKAPLQPGYAAGNILNLLRELSLDLSNIDCSYLSIWQADLQDIQLHHANFAHADFSKTVFSRTFGTVLSVAFSPDGQLLVTSNANGDIHFWRISDGQCLLTCQGHTNWVRRIIFSPDGSVLVSSSDDRSMKIWDAQTGHCLRTITNQDHGSYYGISFSPDGNTLVSGGDNPSIQFWDWRTGDCLQHLTGHTGWVLSTNFSRDGKRLVSSASDNTIRIWDIQTGQCLQILEGHQSWVMPVTFTLDGQQVVSSSLDQTVRIWDVHTGECLQILRGHTHWIWAMALSPDGKRIATGSEDRSIKIWDIQSGKCVQTIQGHTGQLWAVAFHPTDAQLASCGDDGTVRIWNMQDGRCLKVIRGHNDCIRSILIDHSGKYLISGGKDCKVHMWDLSSYSCLHSLSGHTNSVLSIALSPDGRTLASSSEDHTINLWDLDRQICLRTLRGHQGGVWSVTFSPDGQQLASGSFDQSIRIWDVKSGDCVRVEAGYVTKTGVIDFSPDGCHLAAASNDANIKVLNLKDSSQSYHLEGHVNWGRTATFSPDGKLLATGGIDNTVRLWDLATRICIRTLTGHTGWILATTFSPDGKWLASASCDNTVKIWNIRNGECIRTIKGHSNWVWSVAFSPTGELLASAGEDETIILWDWQQGQSIATLQVKKLYEGMNLTDVKGLTPAQQVALKILGAIEQ